MLFDGQFVACLRKWRNIGCVGQLPHWVKKLVLVSCVSPPRSENVTSVPMPTMLSLNHYVLAPLVETIVDFAHRLSGAVA